MTAAIVWPFPFVRPYRELEITEEDVMPLGHGTFIFRDNLKTATLPNFMLQIRAAIRINGSAVLLKTWQDWKRTYGTTSGFLVKATDTVNASSSNYNTSREVVAEAVGTGDNSTVAFGLDMRHIDASTLTVYIDGAPQTGGGTDYTLSGNNATPIVTFNSAPAGGEVITADYDYYWPMRLGSWSGDEHKNGPVIRVEVTLAEEQHGQHRAA